MHYDKAPCSESVYIMLEISVICGGWMSDGATVHSCVHLLGA